MCVCVHVQTIVPRFSLSISVSQVGAEDKSLRGLKRKGDRKVMWILTHIPRVFVDAQRGSVEIALLLRPHGVKNEG